MTTKLLFVCICTIVMVLATGCVSIPFIGNSTPSEPGQVSTPAPSISVSETPTYPDATPKISELGFEITVKSKYHQEPNPAYVNGAYFIVASDGISYEIDMGDEATNKEVFDSMNDGGIYRVMTQGSDRDHPTVWITNVLTNTKAWWKFW